MKEVLAHGNEIHPIGGEVHGDSTTAEVVHADSGTAEPSTTAHSHLATQHLGHILIFGGGLVASIILLVRNYLKNRKVRKLSEQNISNLNS